MKKVFGILLIFIAVLSACEEKVEGYHVDGKVDGLTSQELVLEFLTFKEIKAIDTTTTDIEGNYAFDGLVEEAGFYRIRAAEKFWIVYLENFEVTINMDANDPELRTLDVFGNEKAEAFDSAVDFMVEEQTVLMDLNNDLRTMQSTGGTMEQMQALQLEMQDASALIIKNVKSYIDNETNPLIGIYLLSSLNIQQDFDYIKAKLGEYESEIPNSIYVMEFKENIAGIEEQLAQQAAMQAIEEKVKVGEVAQDIVMKNPQGVDLKLSDLRGKVVLLDFWASWCKPCRWENPNVVALYEQYKDKGFDVFSVSLDQERDSWLAAIEADGLVWSNHVSDLSGWQNSAAQLYGVQGIPKTYLLDENGVIIAKDLRGEALVAKLAELL